MTGATSPLCGQKIKYWSLRPFRLDDHPRQAWDGAEVLCHAEGERGWYGAVLRSHRLERGVGSCILEIGQPF